MNTQKEKLLPRDPTMENLNLTHRNPLILATKLPKMGLMVANMVARGRGMLSPISRRNCSHLHSTLWDPDITETEENANNDEQENPKKPAADTNSSDE